MARRRSNRVIRPSIQKELEKARSKNYTEQLSVLISENMKDKLWDIADTYDCEMSAVVRAALTEFIGIMENRQLKLPPMKTSEK